jgi:hypothetical protein
VEIAMIGFTGARKGLASAQYHALRGVLERRPPGEVFAHGDALGADEMAHALAESCGLVVHVYPCDQPAQRASCRAPVVHPPAPPLERNRAIVDAVAGLFACPSGPEHVRSGTWSTVRYARSIGRPVVVVWPDGKVVRDMGAMPDPLRDRVTNDPAIRRLVAAVDGQVESVERSRIEVP